MSTDDSCCERLLELGDCAYRLGKVFAAEAEQADTISRKVEFYRLFDRCFFSVRMAISLRMRLRRLAAAPAAQARQEMAEPALGILEPELEPPELEQAERERLDGYESEREREREPASLPLLLKTLNGVADAATALPGPPPAELPTLRELLARIAARPVQEAQSVRAVQPAASALRARRVGAASAVRLRPEEPPPGTPPRGGTPPFHRATGPP